VKISKQTERRFVLGSQGLWPGRRWKGSEGTRAAISECRRIQIDPLDVIGRNQDLVLASRVEGYQRTDLETLLYRDHAGFEHGGSVAILPRECLRLKLSWVHHFGLPARWERWYRENESKVRLVREEIHRLGPREARDYVDGERTENYRSKRVEGLALYYLWRRLEILIHHREGNRKFYDLTERMFEPLPTPLTKEETLEQLAFETISWLGISGHYGIAYLRTQEDGRGRSQVTKSQIRQRLIDNGRLAEVTIEGDLVSGVLATESLPILEELAAGEVPGAWRPLSEQPEALLIAPLDIVAARERARTLFDFEYLWEVYKPASKRRWGYYVLPVLLGDRLIGRIEPSFDRATDQLRIGKAWWERGIDLREVAESFARGLRRTAAGLGASKVRLGRVGPSSFKETLEELLRSPSSLTGE
jgi:uncharacterized protein